MGRNQFLHKLVNSLYSRSQANLQGVHSGAGDTSRISTCLI